MAVKKSHMTDYYIPDASIEMGYEDPQITLCYAWSYAPQHPISKENQQPEKTLQQITATQNANTEQIVKSYNL